MMDISRVGRTFYKFRVMFYTTNKANRLIESDKIDFYSNKPSTNSIFEVKRLMCESMSLQKTRSFK